jgi:hypothetical protein
MEFVKKTLFVLTNFCRKARTYTDGHCYFNVKVILSLFLFLNLFSFTSLFFGKDLAWKNISYLDKSSSPVLEIISIIIIIYMLLTVFYPSRKVFLTELNPDQEKKIFFRVIIYCVLTMLFMAVMASNLNGFTGLIK